MKVETVIRHVDLTSDNDVAVYKRHFHMLNEDVPPTEFIGGIFPLKHVSIIASKSGVGKTWYLLKLFTDISNGGTVFLQQAFNQPARKCLLFCGETGHEMVIERINIMKDKPNFENFVIVSYLDALRDKIRLNLDDPQGCRDISNYINIFKPDIVAFDTMMSFREDDENNAQNTSLVLSNLKKIAENCTCAIIGTHHVRKQDVKSTRERIDQDEIIGSSAMVRRAAVAYILSKTERAIGLRPVKSWWNRKAEFYYEIVDTPEGLEFQFSDPADNMTDKRLRTENIVKNYRGWFTSNDIVRLARVSRSIATQVISVCAHEVNRQGNVIYYASNNT